MTIQPPEAGRKSAVTILCFPCSDRNATKVQRAWLGQKMHSMLMHSRACFGIFVRAKVAKALVMLSSPWQGKVIGGKQEDKNVRTRCKKRKEDGTLGHSVNFATMDSMRECVGFAAQRQEGIDDLRVIKGNQCQQCSQGNKTNAPGSPAGSSCRGLRQALPWQQPSL